MTLELKPDHVTVRMYNVGFGDCFLLAFPREERPRKVLIDCGSHSAGRGPRPIDAVVGDLIGDVTDEDGVARIDIVIGTHRHQDHVSGFDDERWGKVHVGEVWMPWSEDPRDAEGRRIRETQSRTARHLGMACAALAAATPSASANALRALADNQLTNAAAMKTLHQGFRPLGGERRVRRVFLPYRDRQANSFEPRLLEGVTVHAMGPSRDPEVIRDMDPPIGQSYLRFAGSGPKPEDQPPPFSPRWRVDAAAFETSYAQLMIRPTERRTIDNLDAIDYLAVAVALEKAVNGTSLMLMFETHRSFLLFPGDAQWGTWNAAIEDEEWASLLERTTLYKIGHHGSHNATPRRFLENLIAPRSAQEGTLLDDFAAMVSTRPIKMWKQIPKRELLERLGELTEHLARSDKGSSAPGPFSACGNRIVDVYLPM
jgi:beta-lactamase superfamily II metal-dependent hydrolase